MWKHPFLLHGPMHPSEKVYKKFIIAPEERDAQR